MPVIQQRRALALGSLRLRLAPLPGAAALALAAWLAALLLVTMPGALRLDAPALAAGAYDVYAPAQIDGRPAVFTRERPEIPLPRRAAGPALVELTMRAPADVRERAVAVRLAGGPAAQIAAAPAWRRYALLLPGGAPLAEGGALVLETEASRFAGDGRRIGVTLSSVSVLPDRAGPSWPWPSDALALLLALALAAGFPLRLRARPAAALLAGCAALVLAAWLLAGSLGAALLLALALAGLHGALALVRAWPRVGRRLWRPAAAGVVALALAAALLAPGGPALTALLAPTAAVVSLTLCYAGFGLAWFLCTPRLAPALPLMAPAIGAAALAIAGHALGTLPVGTDVTAWPLLGALTLVNIAAWRQGARPRLTAAHAPGVAAALLALAVALAPLYQLGYLTTMGGTIDAVSYLTRAEQIQTAGLLVAPPADAADPVARMVSHQLGEGMRQGDAFVLGFFASLLGMRPHALFPVLMAALHALTALGAYVLAAYVLGLGRWAAGAAAALTAVNALLHWALMDNFLSQVAGTALWCFTLAAAATAWRAGPRGVLLAGVLAAALASFYHVFLIYLAAPAGLLAAYELWRARRALPQALAGLAARGAALAGLALLLVPAAWWLTWRQLQLLGGMVTRGGIAPGAEGNILVYPHPAEVFGLVSHAQAAYDLPLPQTPALLASGLGLLLGALALLGAARARPRARWLLGALAITFAAALAHQRLWFDMGRGFPYGYYKVISLAAPIATILAAAGAAALARDVRRRAPPWRDGVRAGAVWLLGGLACVSALHLALAAGFVNRAWLQADAATLEVAQAARLVPPGEPLLVIDERHPGRTWLLYLLRRRGLYEREPNPGWPMAPAAASPRPVRYALLAEPERPREARPGEPWFDPAARAVMWRNARYALLRAN